MCESDAPLPEPNKGNASRLWDDYTPSKFSIDYIGAGTIMASHHGYLSGELPTSFKGDSYLRSIRNYMGRAMHADIRVWCIDIPPDMEVDIWDPTAGMSLFQAASGRHVFSWEPDFDFYGSNGVSSDDDPYLRLRCANCGEESADDESKSNVVKDEEPETRYLYLYWMKSYENDMKEYWIAAQNAKIAVNERLLREIRSNWLRWFDRVDRGHPIFEVETDDLNRQCERAEVLIAELDALEAPGYREWFDVCDEN